MSIEGEDDVTPMRECVAVATTHIKASVAPADPLAA